VLCLIHTANVSCVFATWGCVFVRLRVFMNKMLQMKAVDLRQWPCKSVCSCANCGHFVGSLGIKIKIDSCRCWTLSCDLPLHISCIDSKLGVKKCVLEDVNCIKLIQAVLQCCQDFVVRMMNMVFHSNNDILDGVDNYQLPREGNMVKFI
jgi:hypothetical protein